MAHSTFLGLFYYLVAKTGHIISLAGCHPHICSANSWSEQSQRFLGSSECHHSLISVNGLEVVTKTYRKCYENEVEKEYIDCQVLRLKELELVCIKRGKKSTKPLH